MFRTVLASSSAKTATETCLKGSCKKLVAKNLTAKSSSRRLL